MTHIHTECTDALKRSTYGDRFLTNLLHDESVEPPWVTDAFGISSAVFFQNP
jgi:hypothetical protein